MVSVGNGQFRHESEAVPPVAIKHDGELEALERHESPQREDLSHILARASQDPHDHRRLKELIAGLTQEPRAAINHIEQEIGSLRDMMAVREQVLFEAIDEHSKLSKEAVHGLGVVRKALGQIRDAFKAARESTSSRHEERDS
jgi:hypothetical protein